MIEKAPDAHRSHVARFLRYFASAEEDGGSPGFSEEDYLGRVEEEWLWELVGFRLRSHASLLLALVQFRRQSSGTQPHGRVSLVHHLSSPSRSRSPDEVPPPSGVVSVVPVPTSREVPSFLQDVREGHRPTATWLDRSAIQMAFDFRPQNPSDRRRPKSEGAVPLRRVRTMDGHLLEARSEDLHTKLHRDLEYIALVDGVQRTPKGSYTLPTLIVHRSYLAADWPGPEEGPADRALAEWEGESPLFSAQYGNPKPLLR